MNHLPRKILHYQTPTEAILAHFNQIQITYLTSDSFISKSGRLSIAIYE